jgi:hypothetical protein
MESDKFIDLKNKVQEIIDLIARKQNIEANSKITTVNEMIDELLDFSKTEDEVFEISRFQLLLGQLRNKITAPNN